MCMKKKIRIKHIVLAVVNLAAIIAMIVLTFAGKRLAGSQRYNYAAERWTQGEGGYTQVSCFFSEDSGFTRDNILPVRLSVKNTLKTVAVTDERCPDAYSVPLGRFVVTCDTACFSQAEVTAASGEFFMFRCFDLLSGNYFSDRDIMQDGTVIDRTLAFSLYGSDDVVGMNIYINNVSFKIAGVIDDPQTKYERECAGNYPKAYISYSKAAELAGTETFTKVTCYECIVPDPVDGFGYRAVSDVFRDSYEGKLLLVNNTERFTPSVRVKALKNLSRSGVRDDSVRLPYWENASRIVEHKLTVIYSVGRALLAVPVLTAVWYVIQLFRLWVRKKRVLACWISDKLYSLWCRTSRKESHSRFN